MSGRGDRGGRPGGRSDGGGRYNNDGGGRSSGRGDNQGGRGGGRGDAAGGRGDYQGGGRGGGGGRGDFRGGGGRGGGRGKNRHMGEVGSVLALTRAAGMSDREILTVIKPSAADRNRTLTTYDMPAHETWRLTNPIGAILGGEHIVRTNFFLVDTTSIPRILYHYAIHVYPYLRSEQKFGTIDCCGEEDTRVLWILFNRMVAKNPEWNLHQGATGYAYNGKSVMYTSALLPFPAGSVNDRNEPYVATEISIPNLDGSESKKRYRISLTLTKFFELPHSIEGWKFPAEEALTALDSPFMAFARSKMVEDNPDWLTVGSSAFRSSSDKLPLSGAYVGMRGYYNALKPCLAGLTLVSDMSVTCFLTGGDIISIMAQVSGYRSVNDFTADCRNARGLRPDTIKIINATIKNAKVKLAHIGHNRKARSLGPPANHPDSAFDFGGKKVTVADYYALMCKDQATGAAYRRALPGGKLRFPEVPTINVGNDKKPVLIPPELVVVPDGQCRMGACTGDMTSKLIKYSAVVPDERMSIIKAEDNFIRAVVEDHSVVSFGLNKINTEPMSIASRLLPPAKLKYGGGQIVEPGLAGSWRTERLKCLTSPPQPGNDGTYPFIVMLVGNGPPQAQGWQQMVEVFVDLLQKDCAAFGVRIVRAGNNINTSPNIRDLQAKFELLQAQRVRLVVVALLGDFYGEVKLAGNSVGITTQCLKWKNIERTPGGLCSNLVLKINTKLGGTNHTLQSRQQGNPTGPAVFQDPPDSISWLFDQPCMLVGMDVSHAEIGRDSDSVAAVVASMDGRLSQYAAHISIQTSREEMNMQLADAMKSLLEAFKARNKGVVPARIIVYRDGVSDGQFEQIITKELPGIKTAFALMGYLESSVQIAIVVCQKNHHTRLFYEDNGIFINPCPGLVVDASGGSKSIASARYNEFYLNSHYSLQGTSKPCKYTLIYDEIGIKISELELMTYWNTYLYCRCTKSVSYATPAYYAHWASKQGRYIMAAGGTQLDLAGISAKWLTTGRNGTMFFI